MGVGGTSTFIYHDFVVARLQVLSALVGWEVEGRGGGMEKNQQCHLPWFCSSQTPGTCWLGGGGRGGGMEKTQQCHLPWFCSSQTPGTCWLGGGGGGGAVWRKPSTVIYHDFVVARLQVLSALAGLPSGSVVLGPPVQLLYGQLRFLHTPRHKKSCENTGHTHISDSHYRSLSFFTSSVQA